MYNLPKKVIKQLQLYIRSSSLQTLFRCLPAFEVLNSVQFSHKINLN